MSSRAFFENLWSQPMAGEEEEAPPLCRFASAYQAYAATVVTNTLQSSTTVRINQAKILLLDKYFEWRNVAPRAHRDKVSSAGHVCIFQVFEAAYNQLRQVELSLTPPQFFDPPPAPVMLPPSPPPPPPQIAGIFLGEEDS